VNAVWEPSAMGSCERGSRVALGELLSNPVQSPVDARPGSAAWSARLIRQHLPDDDAAVRAEFIAAAST